MKYNRIVPTLLVFALIAAASPVGASVSGRRNTAIGATALSLWELARGHTTTGLLAGGGAYYAWNQYSKAHRRSNRRHAFLQGYQAGVRRSYTSWRPARRSWRRYR